MKIDGQDMNSLKQGFIEYLTELSEKNDKEYDTKSPSFAIYKHSEEFEDYLVEVVGLDEADLSENFDDMVVKTDSTEEGEQGSIVMQMLQDAMEQEDVIKALDLNGDGELSQDEIEEFVKNINTIDENSADKVTLSELSQGIQSIYDGNYQEMFKGTSSETPATVSDTPAVQDVGGYGSGAAGPASPVSYSGGGSSGFSGAGGTNKSGNDTPVEVPYEQQDLETLKSQVLPTTKDNVTEAQDKLEALQGDGGDLAQYKSAMDATYDEYINTIKQVNSRLADEIDHKKQEIDRQEDLIEQKELAITKQECTISDLETTHANLLQQKGGLEANLRNLNGISLDQIPEEKRAAHAGAIQAIQGKIQALETQIAQNEAELEKAKDDLKNMKSGQPDSLDALQKKLKSLNSSEPGQMGYLEQQLAELETRNPEVKAAADAYEKQKQTYETQKNTLISDQKAAIRNAQNSLNELNNVISAKEVEANDKAYKPKKFTQPELFDEDMQVKMEMIMNDDTIPYLVIGPEDADPNEELPVIFYMHGLGTAQNGNPNSLYNTGPGKIIPEWDLKNFRGYIICPKNNSNWNSEASAKKLRAVYNNFTATHKVDTDRVSIVGHSLGGQGALYMANAMPDIFKKAASLSPYPPGNLGKDGFAIPTRVYSGSHDECYSYAKNLAQTVGAENVFLYDKGSHGQIPSLALCDDADGDGCSDLIEWLCTIDD